MFFEYNLKTKDIQAQTLELIKFHRRYAEYFHSKTKKVAKQAYEYLRGQLVTEGRRNMNKMAVQVSAINNQSLGHFISNSPWDEKPLMDAIRQDALAIIGNARCKALIWMKVDSPNKAIGL